MVARKPALYNELRCSARLVCQGTKRHTGTHSRTPRLTPLSAPWRVFLRSDIIWGILDSAAAPRGTVGLMRRSSGNDLLIAESRHGEPLILTSEQRSRHLYVTGSTGSGKSKFLEYLIRQDIVNWRKSECGLLLLDPHGDIYNGMGVALILRPQCTVRLGNSTTFSGISTVRW